MSDGADGLRELAGALRSGAPKLDTKADELARNLAETCAALARQKAPGSIAEHIYVRQEADGAWSVVCDHEGAIFVEFGTGIGTPSHEAFDQEAMAEAGYEVNGTGRGEKGWVYPKERDGRLSFHFTHGQSGRGFMAKAVSTALRGFEKQATAKLREVSL